MADVVVSYDSDIAKVLRDHERMIKKQEQQIDKYRKMAQESKEAGRQAERTGKRSVSMLGQMQTSAVRLVFSYNALTSGVRLVGDAMQYTRGETDKAIGSMNKLADSRRRLAQIGLGAKDLDTLDRKADTLAMKYGINRDVTRDVLFSARSEGYESVVGDVLKYGHVIDPTSAASVAGQVPGMFKGRVTPQEAMSGTLTAAAESRLDFQELARGMVKLSEGGAISGAGFSETAAVMSVMASRFASGDTAADRFKALSTRMGIDERFAGKGIIGGFETLQGMSDADRSKFLGDSQELNVAYKMLSEELPTVKARFQSISQELETIRAGGDSSLDKKLQARFSTATEFGRGQRAWLAMEQARIGREVETERGFAKTGASRQAAMDSEIAKSIRRGDAGLQQWAGEKAGEMAMTLGGGEKTVQVATEAGIGLPKFNVGAIGLLVNLLGSINDNTKATADAASGGSQQDTSTRSLALQEAEQN